MIMAWAKRFSMFLSAFAIAAESCVVVSWMMDMMLSLWMGLQIANRTD